MVHRDILPKDSSTAAVVTMRNDPNDAAVVASLTFYYIIIRSLHRSIVLLAIMGDGGWYYVPKVSSVTSLALIEGHK